MKIPKELMNNLEYLKLYSKSEIEKNIRLLEEQLLGLNLKLDFLYKDNLGGQWDNLIIKTEEVIDNLKEEKSQWENIKLMNLFMKTGIAKNYIRGAYE